MRPGTPVTIRHDARPRTLVQNQARVTLGTYPPGLGQALVVLYRNSDDTPIWSASVPVHPYGTRPGGWAAVQTGILDCAGGANTPPNAYFRVQDRASGRWSFPQYVTTGCTTP